MLEVLEPEQVLILSIRPVVWHPTSADANPGGTGDQRFSMPLINVEPLPYRVRIDRGLV